ncbi:nucleotide exchange factor GrpE [Candidatus Saccharibacteria bacterium]|nr:nucleotide exchange factor GrpE [Candidatus Saccharibacteria bacterium]
MTDAKKSKKDVPEEIVQDTRDEEIVELTLDLKRTRADFENYRKRADLEKVAARESGQSSAIMKLLPVIDNIERAIAYTPVELKDNTWAQSIAGLVKHLDKSLVGLHLTRIDAKPGTTFDPELHEAIQFDEDAVGEHEVIENEMQAGYMLSDRVIRHAMVKVTKQ